MNFSDFFGGVLVAAVVTFLIVIFVSAAFENTHRNECMAQNNSKTCVQVWIPKNE